VAPVPPSPTGQWRLSAATVAGTSHVESGRGADDAFAYLISADKSAIVAVVADGAGSRSGTSALGSFAACRAVISVAESLIAAAHSDATAKLAINSAFRDALASVEARAVELNLNSRDLATTLAVAVLTPDAAVFAQIGDGILVCEIDGQPLSLVPEVKGDYANETDFLTSPNAVEKHLRVEYIRSPVRRFSLSTDGLRYKILRLQEGGTPFAPFFDVVWAKVETDELSSNALAEWLAELDDQTGDDKTLIVGGLVEGYQILEDTLAFASSPEPPAPVKEHPSHTDDSPFKLTSAETSALDTE